MKVTEVHIETSPGRRLLHALCLLRPGRFAWHCQCLLRGLSFTPVAVSAWQEARFPVAVQISTGGPGDLDL